MRCCIMDYFGNLLLWSFFTFRINSTYTCEARSQKFATGGGVLQGRGAYAWCTNDILVIIVLDVIYLNEPKPTDKYQHTVIYWTVWKVTTKNVFQPAKRRVIFLRFLFWGREVNVNPNNSPLPTGLIGLHVARSFACYWSIDEI